MLPGDFSSQYYEEAEHEDGTLTIRQQGVKLTFKEHFVVCFSCQVPTQLQATRQEWRKVTQLQVLFYIYTGADKAGPFLFHSKLPGYVLCLTNIDGSRSCMRVCINTFKKITSLPFYYTTKLRLHDCVVYGNSLCWSSVQHCGHLLCHDFFFFASSLQLQKYMIDNDNVRHLREKIYIPIGPFQMVPV